MLLFQLAPQQIGANVSSLVPIMLTFLAYLPKVEELKSDRLKARFVEFLSCQVKTLSFLIYLLRQFGVRGRARAASTRAEHDYFWL